MITINSNSPPEALKPIVEQAWETVTAQPGEPLTQVQQMAVEEAVSQINRGHLRVACYKNGAWQTQVWLKQAILLFFKMHWVENIEAPPLFWVDKIPVKKFNMDMGVRVVPPA